MSRVADGDPGSGPAELAAQVITALAASGQTVAVAESLTGGQLAASITAVPGASTVFRAAIVAYATELKHDLLGVAERTLVAHGAVAAQTCAEMARGVAARCGSDWALATTGVAGPDAQEGHPVGTAYVAVVARSTGAATVQALHLSGDRASIQRQTVVAALTLLLEHLSRIG